LKLFRRKGKILSRFIQDLKSGKLHREFHFGPDPETDEEVKTDIVEKSQEESPHEGEINENDVVSIYKSRASTRTTT